MSLSFAYVGINNRGNPQPNIRGAIMHKLTLLIAIVASTTALLAAVPAQAQATRTWVSGVGDDVNPCSRTAPCKTFSGAISKTAAGGEINCIDPGGFGALTIVKAITIDCANTEGGVLVAGTNGISVNAGVSDVVTLRGLDILGITALSGVVFNTGAALYVEKCIIRGFLSGSSFGILFQPTGSSRLFVADTTISNNGGTSAGGAIKIKGSGSSPVRATISRVKMYNNGSGLTVDGSATSNRTFVDVNNSVAASSVSAGISIITPSSGGGTTNVLLDRFTTVHNTTGISSTGAKSAVFVVNSSVMGNDTGLTFSGGGQIVSYQNNFVNSNLSDGSFSSTLAPN